MDNKGFEETKRNIRKNIGQVIMYCRNHASKSQQELADILYVNKSTISRYETGKTEIPAELIPIISYTCHVSLKDMLKRFDTDTVMTEISEMEKTEIQKQKIKTELENLPEEKQELIAAGKTILSHIDVTFNKDFSDMIINAVVQDVVDENRKKLLKNHLLTYYKGLSQIINKSN